MITIVTECPECSALQLADINQLGRKVRCAKCEAEFKCDKKLGPVLWAREVREGVAEGGFEKVASHVLFIYGVAVPVANQQVFLSHMSETLNEGATRNVVILLDGRRYAASVSYFKNKRGEPALHFKWRQTDEIGIQLRRLMPEAYVHFIENKSRDFLPGQAVVMTPGENPGEFNLRIKNQASGTSLSANKARRAKKIAAKSLHSKDVADLLADLSV